MSANAMLDLFEELGENAWILVVFAISVLSWVAGKLKEWSQRRAGVNKPAPPPPRPEPVAARRDPNEDEPEEPAMDLAVMLGLAPPPKPHPPSVPRRPDGPARKPPEPAPPPPIARPINRVALPPPAARPAPAPEPAPAEPDVAPTLPARRARFGRIGRSEIRRGIILAEVLNKPLALRDESF